MPRQTNYARATPIYIEPILERVSRPSPLIRIEFRDELIFLDNY